MEGMNLALTVLLSGLIVVFFSLVALIFIIKGSGKVIGKFEKSLNNIKKTNNYDTNIETAPAEYIENDADNFIPKEIIAAISASIYSIYNVELCRNTSHRETYYFRVMIRSGKTEALIKSAGSISNASARSKKTSSEKLFASPGASIALIRERLIPAFSASCSCDIPRILRSAAMAIPNWMKRS